MSYDSCICHETHQFVKRLTVDIHHVIFTIIVKLRLLVFNVQLPLSCVKQISAISGQNRPKLYQGIIDQIVIKAKETYALSGQNIPQLYQGKTDLSCIRAKHT